jgi:hypothetical protein
MAQPQAAAAEPEQPIGAPEAEGTEYEGMTEEEIERAEFEKVVAEDPDLEDQALPPEPELVEEADTPPVTEEASDAAGPPTEPDVPSPEAVAQEQADDGDAGEVAPEPTGLEWLEELPEEKRTGAKDFIERQGQASARLEQRVSSHLGQLRPAQRTIAQLQTKIRQMADQAPAANPITNNPTVEAQKKAYNEWVDSEYEDFPEEAAKLKTRYAESLDGVLGAIPAPQQRPAPTLAGPNPREERMHLEQAYSDWGERRYSPEFDQWIATQQPDTKQLLNSPFAADNVALLDAFTRDNPDWTSPQTPDAFHSLQQARHSPLFRGWAEAEGINPDANPATLPDYQRDMILSRFKQELTTVQNELHAESENDPKVERLAQRRSNQLKDRGPGSRRVGIKPGEQINLDTEEGQRAYYKQLIASDPELKD